jgi:SAM-dependent methyltransferase
MNADDVAPGHMAGAPHHPGRTPNDLYLSRPPWDIGRPQPAFLALAHAGAIRGRVLDTGCGTGEHALMAAGLGLDATGADLASNALQTARDKARERGLEARFIVHDARRLADLGESFDTILDCGLFHLFAGEDRAAYVDALRSVVADGGRYFMLAFSDREPRERPGRAHKLTREEIEAAFTDGWHIDSIEEATIDSVADPEGIRAWLTAVTRLPSGNTGTAC